MYIVFFRYNSLFYSLKDGIKITFICTGKPKSSCDSVYCDICFIAVV